MADSKPLCVHVSSVHSPLDPRIRLKQMSSIAEYGYRVRLLSSARVQTASAENPSVYGLYISSGSRLVRFLVISPLLMYRAFLQSASLYHLHDPELLPWVWLLLLKRVPVVYDIHEDYSLAVLQRSWIPAVLRPLLGYLVNQAERFLSRPCIRIIAETCYRSRFPSAVPVLNYPVLPGNMEKSAFLANSREILYTGNISMERGAANISRFIAGNYGYTVHCIGACSQKAAAYMQRHSGPHAENIRLYEVGSYVPFARIREAYQKPAWLAGIVLISDSPHYRNKQLTKFFEYMAAGLPIIASAFPVWQELIEDQGLGICVDPEDPAAIAEALQQLQKNPQAARQMGERGQQLVQTRYTWQSQADILLQLYASLLESKTNA